MTEKVVDGFRVARHAVARRVALVTVAVAGLLLGGTAAYAEPPAGVDSLFTSAESTLTGTLIPAVVSIVLIGALFWLGIRWFQKGKNAGNR